MSKSNDEVINGLSGNDRDSDRDSDSDSDSDYSTDSDEDNKIPKKFRKSIIKYTHYDDIIKEKNEELKELKEKRKSYDETTQEYMEEQKIKSIGINGGKIYRKKSKTKNALTLSGIRDTLKKNILNDDDLINKIMADLRDNRATTTKVVLKRTFTKTKTNTKTKKKPKKKK